MNNTTQRCVLSFCALAMMTPAVRAIPTQENPYVTQWTVIDETTTYDWPRAITLDPAGQIYVGGSVSRPDDWVFVSKFDALGHPLWTNTIVGNHPTSGSSVAVDSFGYVFMAGGTPNWFDGHGETPTSGNGTFPYVFKYDPSGNQQWVRTLGGADFESIEAFGEWYGQSVALDAVGNAYLTANALLFNDGTFQVFNPTQLVTAKYNRFGQRLWLKAYGFEEKYDRTTDSATDAAGNLFVTGYAYLSRDFESDVYIRKLDPQGDELWARQFVTAENERAEAITVDDFGNAVIVGSTEGSLPGQSSFGAEDGFVSKFDTAGNELWTRQFGTADDDRALDVATDSEGSVYISYLANNSRFLAKYNANGVKLWSRSGGGAKIELDDSGAIVLVDSIDGNIQITRLVASIPGDTNGDGYVDNGDLAINIANHTGPQTDPPTFNKTPELGDTDGDGDVDNGDVADAISNYTGPPPDPLSVPEPTSLALFGLAGVALLARRRR